MSSNLLQTLSAIALPVTIVTGGLMVLKALGFLAARPLNSSRIIGAAMFFSLSILILSLGLGHRSFSGIALYLYGIHIPIYFLIGPFLRSYALSVLSAKTATGRSQATELSPTVEPLLRFPGYRGFTPFLIVLLICLPSFFLPLEMKARFNEDALADPYWSLYHKSLGVCAVLGILSVGYSSVRLFFELRIFELVREGRNTAERREDFTVTSTPNRTVIRRKGLKNHGS